MIVLAVLLTAGTSPCLPAAKWGTGKNVGSKANVVSHWDQKLTWNTAPIDDATLRQYVDAVRKMNPVPPTVIDTTGGDCIEIERIAAIVDNDNHCTPTMCMAYDVPLRQPPPPPVWRGKE